MTFLLWLLARHPRLEGLLSFPPVPLNARIANWRCKASCTQVYSQPHHQTALPVIASEHASYYQKLCRFGLWLVPIEPDIISAVCLATSNTKIAEGI